MNREEFRTLIESIGFKNKGLGLYDYVEFRINTYYNVYSFWNGSEWIYDIPYNDLRPIEMYFKRELRSIKIKKILK